jgi:hypothetical protein
MWRMVQALLRGRSCTSQNAKLLRSNRSLASFCKNNEQSPYGARAARKRMVLAMK